MDKVTKYRNKYRVRSARFQSWDYAHNGIYFITICTHKKRHNFGKIVNNEMQLSKTGILADTLMYEIKNHTKNIKLDHYVIMPNHIHTLLTINKPVETRHTLSLQDDIIAINRFRNQGKDTISSIVGSYKSAVAKHANRLGLKFKWQPRFHDHIIRIEKACRKIRDYITFNPQTWEKDKFYSADNHETGRDKACLVSMKHTCK